MATGTYYPGNMNHWPSIGLADIPNDSTEYAHDTARAELDAVWQVIKTTDFQESVLDRFDPTAALPAAPTDGDRYIATATANGWNDTYIYQWDDDEGAWDEYIPTDGNTTMVEDENLFYTFDGAAWGITNAYFSFLGLNDTPASYTGSGGKYPRVNATPDALEFVTPTASEITNVAAGAIVAVTVQAAIDELDTDKAASVDKIKTLFVGKDGDDANDGKQTWKAFETFQAAIDAAVIATGLHLIKGTDGGIFAENLTGAVGVDIDAPNATITGVHTVADSNVWKFGHTIIADTTTGFTIDTVGGFGQIITDHWDVRGGITTVGAKQTNGHLSIIAKKTTVDSGYAFFGYTAEGVSADLGDLRITGTGYAIGAAYTAVVDVRATVFSDNESDAGKLIKVPTGSPVITVTAPLIQIGNLWNVTATTTVNIICASLQGTATMVGGIPGYVLTAGDVLRIPTTDEKAALAATGTPSATNLFMTQSNIESLAMLMS